MIFKLRSILDAVKTNVILSWAHTIMNDKYVKPLGLLIAFIVTAWLTYLGHIDQQVFKQILLIFIQGVAL